MATTVMPRYTHSARWRWGYSARKSGALEADEERAFMAWPAFSMFGPARGFTVYAGGPCGCNPGFHSSVPGEAPLQDGARLRTFRENESSSLCVFRREPLVQDAIKIR
jgi:hypothetical protein